MQTQTQGRTAVEQALTASNKSAAQRKEELKAFLANQAKAKLVPVEVDMPMEAKLLLANVEGASIDDLRGFTVPVASEFKGYVSKKTGLPGWSCGDGYSGKIIAKEGKYAIAVKINLSVFETK